jgi:hypothetical protein
MCDCLIRRRCEVLGRLETAPVCLLRCGCGGSRGQLDLLNGLNFGRHVCVRAWLLRRLPSHCVQVGRCDWQTSLACDCSQFFTKSFLIDKIMPSLKSSKYLGVKPTTTTQTLLHFPFCCVQDAGAPLHAARDMSIGSYRLYQWLLSRPRPLRLSRGQAKQYPPYWRSYCSPSAECGRMPVSPWNVKWQARQSYQPVRTTTAGMLPSRQRL